MNLSVAFASDHLLPDSNSVRKLGNARYSTLKTVEVTTPCSALSRYIDKKICSSISCTIVASPSGSRRRCFLIPQYHRLMRHWARFPSIDMAPCPLRSSSNPRMIAQTKNARLAPVVT